METYTRLNDSFGHIKRISDGAVFCQNSDNKDYLKYLQDVHAGALVSDFDWVAYNAKKASESAATQQKQEESLKDMQLSKIYNKCFYKLFEFVATLPGCPKEIKDATNEIKALKG